MAATALVGDLLRDAAASHPERDAYVHADKRSSTRGSTAPPTASRRRSSTTACGRGDVVVLMLPSSTKFAVCYLGALRIGAITSAVNLRLGAQETASIVARTEPKVTVVGDGASLPRGPDPGQVITVEALKEAFAADPADAPPPALARRPDLHRVDERDDRRAEGRACTTTSARRRSRATSASSPGPATGGSSSSRSRTSAT